MKIIVLYLKKKYDGMVCRIEKVKYSCSENNYI